MRTGSVSNSLTRTGRTPAPRGSDLGTRSRPGPLFRSHGRGVRRLRRRPPSKRFRQAFHSRPRPGKHPSGTHDHTRETYLFDWQVLPAAIPDHSTVATDLEIRGAADTIRIAMGHIGVVAFTRRFFRADKDSVPTRSEGKRVSGTAWRKRPRLDSPTHKEGTEC